jgi:hypothetical protein
MKVRSIRGRAMLVPAVLALVGGCDILSDGPPEKVQVIVDATPQEPLLLIVSSNFAVSNDPSGGNSSAIQTSDTVLVPGPYDHTFTLDPSAAQILVRLQNDGEASEAVHLKVLLDGKTDYDSSRQLGTGEFLEYAYRSLSH